MIEINGRKGIVRIEGSAIAIRSEFAMLVESYFDILKEKSGMNESEVKDYIRETVEDGFKTSEQVNQETKEMMDKISNEFGEDVLRKLETDFVNKTLRDILG